jgi:hypothetical protein
MVDAKHNINSSFFNHVPGCTSGGSDVRSRGEYHVATTNRRRIKVSERALSDLTRCGRFVNVRPRKGSLKKKRMSYGHLENEIELQERRAVDSR